MTTRIVAAVLALLVVVMQIIAGAALAQAKYPRRPSRSWCPTRRAAAPTT